MPFDTVIHSEAERAERAERAEPAELVGVGVSTTLDEARKLCRWRIEQPDSAWAQLDYLQLGFYSHEQVPPELPALVREAGLRSVVHLLEVDLVRPLALQADRIATLLERIEQLEPVCVEEDLGLWCWGRTELEQHMLPPIFDHETARLVADNAAALQASIGVPFFVENPPVYFELGTIDLLSFMQLVAERSGCDLVLDIGHLVGYCTVTSREPEEYLGTWEGIEHVRELHVAGYDLQPDGASAPMWYDNHAGPLPERALALVELACRLAGRPLPVTLEQEGTSFRRIAANIELVSGRRLR